MTPTDRDRELYELAEDMARRRRIESNYPQGYQDYEPEAMIEAIAAAREEGRLEERERCAKIAESEVTDDDRLGYIIARDIRRGE